MNFVICLRLSKAPALILNKVFGMKYPYAILLATMPQIALYG